MTSFSVAANAEMTGGARMALPVFSSFSKEAIQGKQA